MVGTTNRSGLRFALPNARRELGCSYKAAMSLSRVLHDGQREILDTGRLFRQSSSSGEIKTPFLRGADRV